MADAELPPATAPALIGPPAGEPVPGPAGLVARWRGPLTGLTVDLVRSSTGVICWRAADPDGNPLAVRDGPVHTTVLASVLTGRARRSDHGPVEGTPWLVAFGALIAGQLPVVQAIARSWGHRRPHPLPVTPLADLGWIAESTGSFAEVQVQAGCLLAHQWVPS